MSILTFAGRDRFAGTQREQALLRLSWEAEYVGVGLMEAWAEMFPEHAELLTACANMEWFNVGYCQRCGHAAGMNISVEQAAKLGQRGATAARAVDTFEKAAELMVLETPAAAFLYQRLGKVAGGPAVKALAYDLEEHEYSMADWFMSELEGRSDGGAKVFEYLERHGISRTRAVTPRKIKELGGDKQRLVLAAFADQNAADRAASTLKKWEKTSTALKLEALVMFARNKDGKLVERKLGSPIRRMLQKSLNLTDEDRTELSRKLNAGLGVLAWDFQADVVAEKLAELGGKPQLRG
jgi:hypothetical protein